MSWSSRDQPNAALYPERSLLQHRSKSSNRSDEMLTQTHVGYWHFSDVGIVANVRFAPTAVVPQSLFPRIEPRQHRLRQSLACQIGLALSTHLSAVYAEAPTSAAHIGCRCIFFGSPGAQAGLHRLKNL